MTNRLPAGLSAATLPLLVSLLLCLGVPAPACGGELPANAVAVVRAGPQDTKGRHLTFKRFCDVCAKQSLSDIKRQRSGPRAVLEQLIEELMVELECERLGIKVTEQDMRDLWNKLDGKVRRRTGGSRTLRETVKQEGSTEAEFRVQLFHIIRKERVAKHPTWLGERVPVNEQARIQQVGIVIARVRKKTKVEYGVLTIDHVRQKKRPKNLGKGIIATVDSKPITMTEFGNALVLRLPGQKVRAYLDRECKTALMTMQGVGLTNDEVTAEVEHLKDLWPLERELKRDEVWKTVSFKDRFETQFGKTIDDVMQDRYARGLLGLVRDMRAKVTEKEIQAEYEAQKTGLYGPYLLTDLIEVGFSQKEGFSVGGRTLLEARRTANGFARRLARGESWEVVATEINMKRDRSQRARTLRLTQTDNDRVHYLQAKHLRDGDLSTPYETLAEVCVMRRVEARPSRTLESVRPHIREILARRGAREWIEEKVKDPQWVQVRWPLPQRR